MFSDLLSGIVLSCMLLIQMGGNSTMGGNAVQGGGAGGGAGAPTLSIVTTASCNGSSGTAAATCTNTGASAIGDLVIFVSKSQSNSSGATIAFTGTLPCTPTAVIAPSVATWQSNGPAHFIAAIYACIVTSAVTAAPIGTWTSGTGSFTDLRVGTYHSTAGWNATFADQNAQSISASSQTACSTGTTPPTTSPNELIVATCDVFNNSQTWNTLATYTSQTVVESSSAAWYSKQVSVTGTQTAAIVLSAADFGFGMIATFASN